jgi:SAM-dependent methyltransferase
MYSAEYGQLFQGHENSEGAANATEVLGWLGREAQGNFVDYGCGAGFLLSAAKAAGWNSLGVEFATDVARDISARTGVPVVSDPAEVPENFADVLHLGDVIEHLTDIDRQVPEILKLLKKGGLLLAQGPLENNANLFHFGIKTSRLLSRRLNPARRSDMAPYHVLLATAAGQQKLFARFGLQELRYQVTEETWPAPAKISTENLTELRSLGLFVLRQSSRSLSALRPSAWGNRYFYAGRKA